MSFLSDLEAKLSTSESWVLNVIAQLQSGADVIIGDVQQASAWVIAHLGDLAKALETVDKDVQGAIALYATAGLVLPPAVTDAVNGLDLATKAVDAAAASVAGAAGTPQAVVTAFVAGQNAIKAAAAAKAAVAAPASGAVPVAA